MRWNLKHAIRSHITGSMWPLPPFALLVYFVFARLAEGGK
jgi:hypothetical protein